MTKYKDLLPDQLEKHFSNYLIDSWSYSKLMSFSRNEKGFEMAYLYNCHEKESASNIAGKAYHKALDYYFTNKKDNIIKDIVDLEQIAFSYIEDKPANVWKIQKTTPTVDECKNKAIKLVSQLINNFYSEIEIYNSEIKKVLYSELRIEQWLNINGVEIPLPCHLVIDLPVLTNDNKIVIIDHKSKMKFTDEKDLKFSSGKQAITYTLGFEAEMGKKVDEVWFIENKYSKNRDSSPQLICTKIKMDKNTRKLYESIIYEPLRRMIQAVNDPDYVYLINDNDNFTDKAEIYDFWAKTMIAEVDDFNIPEKKKPLIKKRLKKIRDASLTSVTPNVIRNFKTFTEQFIPYDLTNKNMTNQEKIEHVLRSFGITSKVQHTFDGYSSSSYLLELNAGVKIASINSFKLDIANALNVANIRIMKNLFVYNGKSYLAIESGKKGNGILSFDESKLIDNKIPVGVDNFDRTIIWDLDNQSTPHILVCGATGSGKSVFLKSTIEYCKLAGIEDIYIFDPKHEFKGYNNSFSDIEEIELQMMILVEEMEKRVKSGTSHKTLIVFDEFADAVANARKGKELDIVKEVQDGFYAPKKMKGIFGETMSKPIPKMKMKVVGKENSLEENLRILLQKGRSSGFRIISATQRASAKIITGDAKVNFPVQVCFRVPKDIDSIVVLDEPGAESLNGHGDGLIKSPEYLNTIRFQAFYHK